MNPKLQPHHSANRAKLTLPEPAPALIDLYRVREPGDEEGIVRLNRNERQYPLPDWFVREMAASITSELFTNYPITDGFYSQLSSHVGLPEDHLLLTAGSDAAVKAIYHAYIRPGDGVVMLDPSYAMYQVYARMFQANIIAIPFNTDLEIDPERLMARVKPGVRLVMLANPNQPTGTLLDEEIMAELHSRCESVGALLAVDEAYFPFSRTTVLPWIKERSHLVVTRTFSKAAGLAALRIGFVAGNPEVVANLFKVRSVHDVNSVALLAASAIVAHPDLVEEHVATVEAGGRVLAERALGMGLEALPTHANFMLIRVAKRCSPEWLVEELRKAGFLVRGSFREPCLKECIRVTLGPPDLMEAFANCLAGILARHGHSGGIV